MSLWSDIGNVASSVVGTVVNAGEDVVKGAEGAVEGAIGTIAENPLNLLNPLSLLGGAAQGAISNIEGDNSSSVLKKSAYPFTNLSQLIGAGSSDSSVSDLGGSSVEAVLLQLAAKERDRLADKVGQLKNLQAPGADATPQQQSDFDTTKANLMADIQSIENSIQQITTMATNTQKDENDTNMAIARNT